MNKSNPNRFQVNGSVALLNNITCFIVCCIFLLVGCDSGESDQDVAVKDTVIVDSFVNPPDTIAPDTTDLFIWSVDFDNRIKIKNPQLKPAYLQVDSIIKGLNVLNREVLLEKQRVGGDTLYASIAHSEVLTEQMGSSGAAAYIASVVINLTAVPGIRYVQINFTAGSHLEPDTWSAGQFKEYIEVKQ